MENAEQKKLGVFLGKWHTTRAVAADTAGPAVKVDFMDSYKWYPGAFFLIHEAEGKVGQEYSSSLPAVLK